MTPLQCLGMLGMDSLWCKVELVDGGRHDVPDDLKDLVIFPKVQNHGLKMFFTGDYMLYH